MKFAPEPTSLSQRHHRILVDLRRLANAIESRFVPERLAIYVAEQHKILSAEDILMELCRGGYLRYLRAQERYAFTDVQTSTPQRIQIDGARIFLDDSFFKTIAFRLREGPESIDALLRETDADEETENPLTLERVEEALFQPRYAVNGSRTPAARWDAVAADHLYLEQVCGSALSAGSTLRLLSHHYPHLVNPTARRNALRSAGILAPIFPHGKHHNRWTVTELAREVLKKRTVHAGLTQNEAKALLSSDQLS